MAKKPTKKLAKHHVKAYNFFLIMAALLGMMAGVLLVKLFYNEKVDSSQPEVSLGSIEYDFSNGKATKRDTAELRSLREFLTKKADGGCSKHELEPGRMYVIAANDNISQVLLGYGCGDTSARMFAVRSGETWRTLSPTNHFDMLTKVPECSHVKENHIDKSLAPVCFSVKSNGHQLVYQVR